MKYWLMKTEPDECSIDDVLAAPERITPWSGVRNYQARNFMRDQMKVGDGVLFYHSSCPEPGIAGIAEVASAAYPTRRSSTRRATTTTRSRRRTSPRWFNVDVRALRKTRLISLDEMRKQKPLAKMVTLRPGNRLSITPVTRGEWKHIATSCSEERHSAARAGAASRPRTRRSGSCARRDATFPSTTPRARGPAAFSRSPRARARRRGDAAAARALSARRRDRVFRHPHDSRRDGPGARLRRRRRPALRAPAARRSGDPPACRAGSLAELRYVFDAVRESAPRARRPRAADRVLRQPVHARLLHGGRVAAATTGAPLKTHAACAPRPACIASSRSTPGRSRDYLNAQIEAGAQAVMIFDTWGGILAHDDYETFSLAIFEKSPRRR